MKNWKRENDRILGTVYYLENWRVYRGNGKKWIGVYLYRNTAVLERVYGKTAKEVKEKTDILF